MGRKKKTETCVYEGTEYATLAELERKYGVSSELLSGRLNRGFTLEQALDPQFKSKYGYRKRFNSVKFKGIEYKSLREFANAYDIETTTLYQRLESGYSLHYIIEKRKLFEVEFKGKTYSSKKEIADAYGIPVTKFIRRLNTGWTLEQALESGSGMRDESICYDGREYENYKQLFDYFGKHYGKSISRLNKGWTISQVVGHEPPPNSITVNGQVFKNKQEIATFLGISRGTLSARLRSGHTLEEAVAMGGTKRGTKRRARLNYTNIEIDGKVFDNIRQISEEYEVSESKLRDRLRRGYTFEQAVDKDFSSKFNKGERGNRGKECVVHGIKFKNIKEASRHYGVTYVTLISRLRKGYTPEQAVDKDFTAKYTKGRGRKPKN